MLTIVPSHLNGLLLVFTLPFFLRHGDGGWGTDQKFHSGVILT